MSQNSQYDSQSRNNITEFSQCKTKSDNKKALSLENFKTP